MSEVSVWGFAIMAVLQCEYMDDYEKIEVLRVLFEKERIAQIVEGQENQEKK